MREVESFLEELQTYQSNHYGNYDKTFFVNAYKALPPNVKKYLMPPRDWLNKLWRGADGISQVEAISFTTNKGYAGTFGAFNIPFSELKSYGGLVCSEKARKLMVKLKLEFEIGDDEGEVIVISPVWKESIDLDSYRERR